MIKLNEKPVTLYSLKAAQRHLNDLESDTEDTWTYKSVLVNKSNQLYKIEAYDTNGEYAGTF